MQGMKLRLILMGCILSVLGVALIITRGYSPAILGLLLVGIILLIVVYSGGSQRIQRKCSAPVIIATEFVMVVELMSKMTIIAVTALGIIVGAVLASFITGGFLIYYEAHSMFTTVNGWSTTLKYGEWGNNILLRAAFAQVLTAANAPEEAVYWTTTVDSTGSKLNGTHDYIMQFPAGGLPPNDAFWSLTMTDLKSYMVNNSINRYNVGSFSNLVPSTDGSIDVYIQNAAPAGHESNWLPAPSGDFKLWLRVYLPGPTILNGSYHVQPVVEVNSS